MDFGRDGSGVPEVSGWSSGDGGDQGVARASVLVQGVLDLTRALAMVRSLRLQAVMTTLNSWPLFSSRGRRL